MTVLSSAKRTSEWRQTHALAGTGDHRAHLDRRRRTKDRGVPAPRAQRSRVCCDLATNGPDGIHLAKHGAHDLVILDVMLPGLNGWQVLSTLRQQGLEMPVLFLTARDQVEDRVKGLETGADDYISKPFNTRELMLRIGNILNRGGKQAEGSGKARIQIAGVLIDEDLHELKVDGESIVLTATEFRLLKLLMERKGRVQSRENLLVNVWHYDTDIETRTVDTHVRRVREKLGPYAHLIETVRGVGYRAVDIK